MSEKNSNRPRGPLTRREFIQTTGAVAIAAGAAGGSSLASAAPGDDRGADRSGFDVIVIGAGLAGVTAARELGADGRRILLLEARNRLGGQAFRSQFAGHEVELGGIYIHWSQPHVWAEVTRYGLPVTISPSVVQTEKFLYRSNGQTHDGDPEKITNLFIEGCNRLCADSRAVFPRPYDPFVSDSLEQADRLSMRDRMKQVGLPKPQSDLVDAWWTSNVGNDLSEAGFVEMLRWHALAGHDATQLNDMLAGYHLVDGMASLIDAMIEDGKPEVRLSTVVTHVTQNKAGVVVTTEDDEQLSARAVVVAVPLNTLKNIKFSPAPSEGKLAAFKEGQCSREVMGYIQIRGELGNWFMLAPSPEPINYMLTKYSGPEGTILSCYGMGSDLLNINDDRDAQQMVRAFLPDAEVIQSFAYEWNLDPFSLGTTCFYRPMQMTRYLRELQRAEGRVVYAGSDISNGWRGYFDGAVESGLRAGREVKDLLG